MTDITAFLAARLDEDEAAVHEAAAFYDDADENGVSWRGPIGNGVDAAKQEGQRGDICTARHCPR